MALLVGVHLLEQGAAAVIAGRELREVIIEVLDHLAFGLDDEPETPPIAGKPGRGADGERTGVPERIESARRRTELFEPRATPHEMIVLFAGRLLHRGAGRGIARHQRLAVVERLGRDFTRVIDPHQPCRMPALTIVECFIRDIAGRVLRTGLAIHPHRTAQSTVERDDEPIDSADLAIWAFSHRMSCASADPESTGHPPTAGPRQGFGSHTIADLKGKRIPHGHDAGPLFHFLYVGILANGGLTYDDVERVPVVLFREGWNAFKQGKVDVALTGVGSGIMKEMNATISGGIRYVPFDDSPAAGEMMLQQTPKTYFTVVEPAPGLDGVVAPTKLAVYDYTLYASTATPEDVVYKAVKAIYEHESEFKETGALFRTYSTENLSREQGIPYHPGAEKYYKEAGAWKR